MHFHLPKPLHGWREFAGEVGIIVIGVLIALGAEAVLQKLHENQLRKDTLQAARAELSTALSQFVDRRLLQPCIERRLDEVQALLTASAKPGYRPPSWIGRPQTFPFDSSAWEAASAGGRAALLSEVEQTQIGGIYQQLHDLSELERDEQKSWAEIRQLEGLADVDAQTRAGVRSALAQARLENWNIRVDLEQPVQRAERLGVVGKIRARSASPSICLPLDTPRAEALRRINAYWHDDLGEP